MIMSGDLLNTLRSAVPSIALLVVLEGLLSVDNMLAIASLATRLPKGERKRAVRIGLIGAYVFRGVALISAGLIAGNRVVLFLGALYLLHLSADYFTELRARKMEDETSHAPKPNTFWGTVVAIQFLDLSLSLDNVVVAVGIAPDQMWVVYTGVSLGLLTLWLFSGVSLRLIEKFPVLNHAAFLIIAFIGVLLLLEAGWNIQFPRWVKFAGSLLIVAACLAYERSLALQWLSAPFWWLAQWPIKAYAAITRLILWPFRALAGLWK